VNRRLLSCLGLAVLLAHGTSPRLKADLADPTVDFEKPQTTADFKANFYAIQDTTVKIDKNTGGITVTFTGGELLTNADDFSDKTTIYATTNSPGADLGLRHPLTIGFSSPVNMGTILLANGSGSGPNVGDTVFSLAAATAQGKNLDLGTVSTIIGGKARSVDLSAAMDVVSVTIDSKPASGSAWEYAIDDINFTTTPEPPTWLVLGTGLLALLGYGSQRRT
jgi:hypothetical protein